MTMNPCRQFLFRSCANFDGFTQISPYFKYISKPRSHISLHQPCRNAGHSKWANIKHTKQAKDMERSKETTKFVNVMKIAIKEGGSADPKTNSKLAQVIAQVKEAKLSMSSFDRLLQSMQNRKDEKSMIIPMKGPYGSLFLTEISTDNINRTRQEINTLLRKNHGVTAEDSVLYLFEHKGIIFSSDLDGKPANEAHLDDAIADAIEAGADDVIFHSDHAEFGNVYEFATSPSAFLRVKSALEQKKYNIVHGDVDYIATQPKELNDAEIEDALKLYNKLSDHPNVVKVSTNIA